MSERPNILLVVLDSVRAHNTSLHGYERDTTPFLRSFADEATRYTQARAPGIHSIASHVSMFTGLGVEEHRATNHTTRIDPSRTFWHALHADAGYETGLFTNNRIVSDASNLSECFTATYSPDYPLTARLENTLGNRVVEEAYFRASAIHATIAEGIDRMRQLAPFTDHLRTLRAAVTREPRSPPATERDGHGGEFVDAFLTWQAERDGPWGACINLMDAHMPYHPGPDADAWSTPEQWELQRHRKPSLRDTLKGRDTALLRELIPLYDGAIRQADSIVRDLVTELRRREILDRTMLIITSDHGEAFGESSRIDPRVPLRDHKWGLHEVLTHVPLVVRYPGQNDGRVVTEAVSLTDLPRAIDSVRRRSDPQHDPFVRPGTVRSMTFRLRHRERTMFHDVEGIDRFIGPWRAVYETIDGGVRKYAVRGDHYLTLEYRAPGEVSIISREPTDRVASVFDDLEEADVRTADAADIDTDLEDTLEALGYLR